MNKLILFLSLCLSANILFGQCINLRDSFNPTGTLDTRSDFGKSIAISSDYLAVAETTNDSLESNSGIIYVFKTQSDGSWKKIATLATSEPSENFYLGHFLDFSENIIIAGSGTSSSNKIYVFTKEETEEWEDSTESYSFQIRETSESKRLNTRAISASESFIAISYSYSYTSSEDYEVSTNIYQVGSIDPLVSIPSETDSAGILSPVLSIEFGSDYVALAYPEFRRDEIGNEIGEVHVHNYDEVNGWSAVPKAKLLPSIEKQIYFGIDVEIDNDTIFVANAYDQSNDLFESRVFGFSKPETGWQDANESFTLSTGVTNSTGIDAKITINGETLIHSKWHENQISIFKKDVDWTNQEPDLTFELPGEDLYTNPSLGTNHLVINSRSRPFALSYYRASGDFENLTGDYDIIADSTYSAGNFEFGHSTAIYQDKMVVGALRDGGDGAVYYYEKVAGEWQYQFKIVSAIKVDYFGYAVELYENDLFVSIPFADSLNADGSYFLSSMGKVLHYQLSENGWEYITDIKSPDLDADLDENRHFGRSISYSNNYVAIGRYYTGSSETDGRVFIYKRNGNNWDHVATMQPEVDSRGDFFGYNIKLTNELLIVGARNYGGTHVNNNSPTVFIYNKTDKWSSATEDAKLVASDGTTFTSFGTSLDINESTIVVGAPNADQTGENRIGYTGQVYIFEKPLDGWYGEINEQLILKPQTRTEGSRFGSSVFINDTELLVGGSFHEGGEIFKFDRSFNTESAVLNETEILSSPNLTANGEFGLNISSFNDQIIISAPKNDTDEGFTSGQVFTYESNNTFTREEITSCDSYNWQGDTFSDAGLYINKLVGSNGCDSLKYLELSILKSTEGSVSASSCNSYEWEGMNLTESGIYHATHINAVGCDSLATLNLTVNYSNEGYEDVVSCDFYEWQNQTLTESGGYQANLTNIHGCDSLAILNLTIFESNEGSATVETCSPYIWEGQEINDTGIYNTTLLNNDGCDSLATLDLIILDNDGSEEVNACDLYVWEGITYTSPGEYSNILTNKNGCDSIAYLVLTISESMHVNISVTQNTLNFEAGPNEGNYEFQWFDCESEEPIEGATSSSLIIDQNGSYFLAVMDDVCTSYSDCAEVEYILSVPVINQRVYPNPTQGIVYVTMIEQADELVLSNISGELLPLNIKNQRLDLSSCPAGIYFLTVIEGKEINTIKILKR